MAVQITVYRENRDRLFAFQVFSYTVMHLTTINPLAIIILSYAPILSILPLQ